MKPRIRSGISRSSDQSPPPITFPARAVASNTSTAFRREERTTIGSTQNFCARLAAAVRIVSPQRIRFSIPPPPFSIEVALVGRHHHDGTNGGQGANAFQEMGSSEHIGRVGSYRIDIRAPHQRLRCKMKNNLWCKLAHGTIKPGGVSHISTDIVHEGANTCGLEQTWFRAGSSA